MHKSNLIESFNNAIEGFIYILRHERNIKIHFLIAFLVLTSAILLSLNLVKMLLLLIVIFIVLFAEIINTVVEYTLDMIESNSNPEVKIIKDIAASGVFVSCLFAVIAGYLIFYPYLEMPFQQAISLIKLSSWHVPFITILTILVLVILGKVFFHRGKPLKGGMPSGHSAVAFSIWAITALNQSNMLITVLVLVLAVLIVRSRMKYAVHTLWEVVAGSLLGFCITLLFYKVFLVKFL